MLAWKPLPALKAAATALKVLSPVTCNEIRSSISSANLDAPGELKTESLPRRTSVSSPLSTDLPTHDSHLSSIKQ